MPNTFAYVVFFLWPLVVIVLFLRLPVAAALAWSVIGGYLLIPGRTGFNFPLIPTIDKDGLPSLMAALMVLLVAGRQVDDRRRARRAAGPIRRPARRRPRPPTGARPSGGRWAARSSGSCCSWPAPRAS